MSKKISLQIGNKTFNVNVNIDDEFGSFLLEEMEKDFNMEGRNEALSVLNAYIRQSHKLYTEQKKIQKILDKLQD